MDKHGEIIFDYFCIIHNIENSNCDMHYFGKTMRKIRLFASCQGGRRSSGEQLPVNGTRCASFRAGYYRRRVTNELCAIGKPVCRNFRKFQYNVAKLLLSAGVRLTRANEDRSVALLFSLALYLQLLT